MSNTGDTSKICSPISDSLLKKECEAAAKVCKDDACSWAMEFCESNASWPAEIPTSEKSFPVENPYLCMKLVKILAGKGKKILSPVKSEPAAEVQDVAVSEEESPTSDAAKTEVLEDDDVPAGDDAESAAPKTAPAVNHPNKCEKLEGTEQHGACMEISAECAKSSSWPFSIETTGGYFEAENQSMCLRLGKILAGKGFELGKPIPKSAEPAEPTPDAAPNESVDETPPAEEPEDDDSAATFVKSFADINLRLKVTGDSYATAKRILHFEGGKGIPIKLEYRIEELPSGSYSMDYTVYKGKEQIGEEESITFEASDGKIDLGFEVKLYDPDDFGSIESVTIVNLD